jgi:hypothetical protein
MFPTDFEFAGLQKSGLHLLSDTVFICELIFGSPATWIIVYSWRYIIFVGIW